ncbi:acyl-CoA dehydrogenase family protein [Aeromicrobium sp. IC_218]|uniref:acyl-CoA dehydrogenase family protein n=1 Tax=Aeromicrobium sp. IC_218 TaxID=2545468 RepID=UPI00103F84DF|nr:acyl-CoA dehydrogenase family protein [Aeromicrobium sp. IC_218]TCI95639.1 acyl-CoA dehydrogenase [Aeromicrobium sp. IC_218]
MRLRLSDQDVAFRDEMREFFTTQVPQEIRDKVRDRRELTKDDIVQAQRVLNAGGLAVPGWPVEWGGKDWTNLQRHIWHEEMQLACVPAPLAFNASMIGPVIAAFGSQEIKERFLPATANLDIWWSQGFSEPDAGSDLASLRTTAVRDGDHYVVNGQKTWTTLGQYGDWIFTLVRTNPDAPKKQAGISMLLIDMTTPGLTVRPIELIDGGHEVNEVWFEDVRVPAENLVGEENAGWTYAKFLLGNERVGVAPVGSSKRLLAQAKEHAREIRTSSGTLLDDPLVAARVAELENDLLALELTALRVAAHSADGKPHPASSVLKLQGTVLQQAVTELFVDLAGPDVVASGAADGSQVPHWARVSAPQYLNYRKASIYGGSNEVQRQIIAGTILGL